MYKVFTKVIDFCKNLMVYSNLREYAMKKLFALLMLIAFLAASCAQPKSIVFKDGTVQTVPPYGIINELLKDGKKNEKVLYQLSVKDITLSVILSATIIVPIILLGYNLWEPIGPIDK
ncbi:MAG TPA: hypothetical protein P5082_09545 [Treponema sp.]|jgi:hypothetical protein|nr:hypothetical protein [Treponema sp.]